MGDGASRRGSSGVGDSGGGGGRRYPGSGRARCRRTERAADWLVRGSRGRGKVIFEPLSDSALERVHQIDGAAVHACLCDVTESVTSEEINGDVSRKVEAALYNSYGIRAVYKRVGGKAEGAFTAPGSGGFGEHNGLGRGIDRRGRYRRAQEIDSRRIWRRVGI